VTERTGDEAQILAVLHRQAAAIHAGDAEAALAEVAPDVVKYDLQPPLCFVGPAARDREALEAWFATWDGPIEIELRDFAVTVAGDHAYCHGFQRIGGRQGGQEGGVWTRATFALRRDGNDWKIVHEHVSVPFYMDGSYRAAVDLEP